MEGFDKNEEMNDGLGSNFRQEIYSKAVRAGKRTYFFDVKSTRNDEYYLTITESKKRYDHNGKFTYEKHKIFLYKEDFEKFYGGLEEVISFIADKQPIEEFDSSQNQARENYESESKFDDSVENEEVLVDNQESMKDYTDVEFEDLNK